jgi:hypothetical protein
MNGTWNIAGTCTLFSVQYAKLFCFPVRLRGMVRNRGICNMSAILQHPVVLYGSGALVYVFRLLAGSVVVRSSLYLQIYTTRFGLTGHLQVQKLVL